MSHLEYGSVVWVRLGQAWWPGTITTLARCPPEFVEGIRKTPVAVVKFFHENEFQDVHKGEHIYPYSCERKTEFIKRGQYINKNQSHGEVNLLQKFESDVVTAEKLTGGDMNILETIEEVTDYPTTPTSFHEPDFSSVPQSTLIERPRGCMPGEIVIGERESLKMRSPHSNSTQRVDLGKPGESHYREDCIVEREISSVSTLHKSVSDLSEHQTGSQLPLSRELLQSTQFLQSGQLLQSQAVGHSRPELFAAKEQNSNISDFNTLKRDHSQGIWTVPSDLDRASLSHKVPRSDIQPDRLHKDFSHVPIRTKLSVGTVESEFTKVASNHDSDIREVTFRVPPMSSEVIDLESDPESPEMTEEDFTHVPIRTKFDVGTIESAFTQVASRHDSGIRQIPFRVPPMSSEVIDLESDEEESPEITKDKDTPVSWEPPKEVVERTEVESQFEVMDEEVEDGSESLDEVMEEGEGDDESASHSEEGREEVDNESESHDEDGREEVEDEHKSYHKDEMVEEEDERESYHKDVAEKVEDEPQNNYEDGKEEVEDACQALYKKVKGMEEEPKPKTVDVGMEVDDDTNSETTPGCGKVVEDESSVEAVTRSSLVVDEEEESDNSNESSESYSQVAVPKKSDLMALSLPKGDGNDFTGTKHMTNGNSAAETLLVGDAMAVEDEAMTIVETSKENDNASSALLVQESETIADKNAAVEDAVRTQQLTSESDSVKPEIVEAMEEKEVTGKEADSVKPGRGEAMEKEEVTGKETDSVKPERSEAMEEEDVNGKEAGSATLDEKSEGDHKEEGESKHVESSEETVKDDEHKSEDMSVKEGVKLVSNRKSRKSDKGSSSQKRISKRRREPSQKTRKKAKVTEKKDASEATQDASIGDDDDDDDLPDLSLLKNDVSKLKTGDLVWVKYRKDWWPSYIRNVYRKGRKYSIVFVACDQSYGIRVNSKHVKKLYVWDVPSFVNQSQEGFSSALHLCKLFHELQEQNQDQESQISAHDFFSLSPQAQVALLNQKKKTKGKGKGSTGKKKPKEVIIKSTSVKIPPRKALFDDPDYKNKMSDREKNKLKSAIKARKSDNEKLVRYMMSKTCIDRLWQIYNKEIPCDRHDMYQDPEMKNNPRLCSWGPFQLDDSDDQIMSVIQAFKEEILLKNPKQKDAYDYAFRVWVPEAIKDALRVIKKVPESDLDDALFKGYRETAIEKKYRTINL